MGDRVPHILPLSGPVTVSLTAKAATHCDLVVDLLDETFQWYGGTRTPITAGTQAVTLSFAITTPLSNGQMYRWSIFLTPSGSNYLGALAWYEAPRPIACAIPHLKVLRHGGELFLSWQSTQFLRYQALQTSDLNSDEWWPLGLVMSERAAFLKCPYPPPSRKLFIASRYLRHESELRWWTL